MSLYIKIVDKVLIIFGLSFIFSKSIIKVIIKKIKVKVLQII